MLKRAGISGHTLMVGSGELVIKQLDSISRLNQNALLVRISHFADALEDPDALLQSERRRVFSVLLSRTISSKLITGQTKRFCRCPGRSRGSFKS